MTKPCKHCGKEVQWVETKDGWRPFNPGDLTPHECEEGKAAYAKKGGGGYKGNPKDSQSIENQVCMKEAGETWRSYHSPPSLGPLALTPDEVGRDIATIYRILRDAMREAPL